MIELSLQHHAGWWVAACCGLVTSVMVLYAVALVGLIVIGQWSGGGRALFPAEPLTATRGGPDGCVPEYGDVLADTDYVPGLVLSCWDSAWNLRVVSPESAR